jgi:hypothetical protein
MAQYASANMQAEGVEFFSARLREFEPRQAISPGAVLCAIGWSESDAPAVPLMHRIAWVKETIAMLERAKQLSGGQVFVVNWVAGMVHAQLPSRVHHRKTAQEELDWCVQNVEKAPDAAWLREVYYQLAKLASAGGEQAKAQEYLRRSGYTDLKKPIVLTTAFSEDVASGHAFSPRRIAEIVPGRVYVLSGFEFTEYYFVVSEDGRADGIDAGTAGLRQGGLRSAASACAWPAATDSIFITHAHWDHVGGHAYFRALNRTCVSMPG